MFLSVLINAKGLPEKAEWLVSLAESDDDDEEEA